MDNANASAIEKLAALFPQCVTERKREDGTVEKAIDLEKLIHEIKPYAIEEEACQQRYEFTWPEKQLYSRLANAASPCALRPCREESRGRDGAAGAFDSANVYIEGDNLEALKMLRETYFGKVKMIYIDPPYNTGSDFIYRDRFVQDEEEYLEHSGQLDDEGARLFPNTESNGRFHTDWLNMIYPRLKVARNLLADDGVIFISIDDNEAANLRKVCDELFGEGNFVGQIIIKSNPRGSMSSAHLAQQHEYLLVYAKNIFSTDIIGHALSEDMESEYSLEDENGKYRLLGLRQRGGFWRKRERPLLHYPIYVNLSNGEVSLRRSDSFTHEVLPYQPSTGEAGTWRWSKEKFRAEKDKLIAKQIRRGNEDDWDIFQKDYLNNIEGESRRTKAKSLWDGKEMNYQNGTVELKKLFANSGVFPFPKPTDVILRAIEMVGMQPGDLVLDFFSGSATTAHAVMQLNAEDGGSRRFILVQLPEACGEDSEAFKAGYSNICEIGKERIRRAGDQILRRAIEELEKEGVIETCALDAEIDAAAGIVSPPALGALRRFGYTIRDKLVADAQGEEASSKLSALSSKLSLDTGFRVFKVDSSNMLDVCVTPAEFTADSIYEENIKKDRTPDDLLIQAMLEAGIELSSFIEEKRIEGKRVFFVGGDALAACFDEALTNEAILQIAKAHPRRFCMRDSGYTCDCDADNFEQIFKAYSPHTVRRVM